MTALLSVGSVPVSSSARIESVVTQLESGSLGVLLDRWTQALGGRPRVTLEPFGYEAIRAANKATFGRDAIPYYAIHDAEVVLSFGADFLETWLSNVHYARGFSRMHTFRDGKAGTFIHVEPRQSLTASNADEWVRNAPGTEAAVALAILKLMTEQGADKRFAEAAAGVDPKKVAEDSGVPLATLEHIAKTFAAAKPGLAIGGGVAVSGSHATATQVAVNLLNAAAGNVGKTVRFGPDSAYGKVTPYAEVAKLVQAMAAGEIEVLVLGAGVNPAFTLPGGLKVADAIRKVPFGAGPSRPARHALAGELGRLRADGGRERSDPADDEADPRRAPDGRRAAGRRPHGARHRGRQGPAAVGVVRAISQDRLGAGGEGAAVGRGAEPGRRVA